MSISPKDITARKFEGKPIVGEEGAVLFLPEPLQCTGTNVVKVFHSNYRFSTTGPDESGHSRLERLPRFLFSQSKHGFLRLYHIHRLAHTLFPENVIDMRGVLVPDIMPMYFDPLDAEHLPKMNNGSIQYPELTSNRVPVVPEQEEKLRDLYNFIRRGRESNVGLYHKRGDGLITPFEEGESRVQTESIIAAAGRYGLWFRDFAGKRGLSLDALELKLMEAGFMQSHASVNTLLTPPQPGSPSRLVFCEIDSYVDRNRAVKAIDSLADEKLRRIARHHLEEIDKHEDLVQDELKQHSIESQETFLIRQRKKAYFERRIQELRTKVNAGEKG